MLLDTAILTSYSLLLLRIIIAIIFFSSGKSHVQNPKARGKSIGMSAAATSILGIAEIVAAFSIALGIYAQIGAVIIIVVMLGAIYKKVVEWKVGFYADEGFGWHYDLILLFGALVIFTTAGGKYVII